MNSDYLIQMCLAKFSGILTVIYGHAKKNSEECFVISFLLSFTLFKLH